MRIEGSCVIELYRDPGFPGMVAEYSQHSNKLFPVPTFRQEEYQHVEDTGALSVWRVMCGDTLAGFMTILTSHSLHFGVKIGVVESLFVMKKYRMTGAGKQLVDAARQFAKAQGLSPLIVQCPYGAKLARLLENEGFTPEIICYCLNP